MKIWIPILLAAALAAPVQAQFSNLVVFGDSLSDIGNLSAATLGFQPGSDYFEGRFSNGPVYSELLAEKLELGPLIRSGENGTNYAYGGARTAGTTFFEGGFAIKDLDEQIDDFFAERQVTASELYVVFAGSNDFILGDATNAAGRAQRVVDQVDKLIDAGAQNILSINLPRLGVTPDGTPNAVSLNARSVAFNNHLESGLDAMEAANVNLFRLDLSEVFDVLLEEPGAFGFTNTVDTGISAADASGYLFWDGNHPTTEAHAHIAEAAYRTVQSIPAFGGDFDFDQELTVVDVDLLSRQLTTDTQRLSFDLDQSGQLDQSDVATLLEKAMRINGDSNFDGEVAFSDFLPLSRNFGRNDDDLRWSHGDFDSNGEVGFLDFLIFSRNFGVAPMAVAVPEPQVDPTTLLLCTIFVIRRRRPNNVHRKPK